MTGPRAVQAAGIVRAQIADGTLKPGSAAPSGAALAHVTGFSALTCRKALRALVRDGTLVPGPSPGARPRVAASDPGSDGPVASATRELSAALAARRHDAGLTQPGFAAVTGYSVTTVGHAETGRNPGSPGNRLPRPVTGCFVRSFLRGGRVICSAVRDAEGRPQSSSGHHPLSLPLLTFVAVVYATALAARTLLVILKTPDNGRTWQARRFWESADAALGADGELLALYDARQAAAAPAAGPGPDPVCVLVVWRDGSVAAVPRRLADFIVSELTADPLPIQGERMTGNAGI